MIKMIVDLFIPCYIDQLYPDTAMNMVKVLERLKISVNYNMEQTCCGQPAYNAGFREHCREVGHKFIQDFNNDRYIVCPSASCVAMVKKNYPEMFHNSSLHNEYKEIQKNIYEFSDFLVNVLKVTDVGARFDAVATFHDSCVALRQLDVNDAPRQLLQNVRGLKLVEMEETDVCCGFGGSFSIKFEPLSVSLAEEKIANARATEARYLISTDYTCLMHIDSVMKKQMNPLKVMHLADILAAD